MSYQDSKLDLIHQHYAVLCLISYSILKNGFRHASKGTWHSELPKEGTCNHAAGPASTCPALCRYAGYCDINFFSTTLSRFRAILQHQWCLMGNVICYWILLGLASSCRLIVLLVFELLNSGLHASTRQLTSLHTACMHRQGSEQVCIMNHKPTEDCY